LGCATAKPNKPLINSKFKIINSKLKIVFFTLNFELHCWVETIVKTQPTGIDSAAISDFIDFSFR